METETIKSKRRLSQSMGDLYLLKNEKDILNRPDINRGYVMATVYEGNLYSYSFALCDNSHEIGELDKIIVEHFVGVGKRVPIPFDNDYTRGGNSQDLENYLNRHFGNKLLLLKTETGLALLQRNADGSLIKPNTSLIYPQKPLSYDINALLITDILFGNIPITEYVFN